MFRKCKSTNSARASNSMFCNHLRDFVLITAVNELPNGVYQLSTCVEDQDLTIGSTDENQLSGRIKSSSCHSRPFVNVILAMTQDR